MYRNITSLGLATDYAQNEDIRAQCRHLMALGLLPLNEVEKQFQRLRTIASATLDDLFIYFERQWMKGSVPREMWNFNNFEHRTNNICECMYILNEPLNEIEINTCHLVSFLAYNSRFSSRLYKSHPNIWAFIQLIKSEHVRLEHISIQLAAGASAPKPSAKTKAFQSRFVTLNARFMDKQINAKELLAGLALLIGKKKA